MPLEDRPSTGDSQAEPRATVMVVDDEAAVRRVLVMRLQLAGYRVICAEDGEEALTLFHQEQPDLIVLDVMLPKLDGFAVCRRLRAESCVPIICAGWAGVPQRPSPGKFQAAVGFCASAIWWSTPTAAR